MCMLCAAVPMSAAVGIYSKAKWTEKVEQATQRGDEPPKWVTPEAIQRTSLFLTGGLIAGAVVYHAVIAPRLGSS
jgi:hypothetical protein